MHEKIEIKSTAGIAYDVEIEVWREAGDLWRYEVWCGGVTIVKNTFECVSAHGTFEEAVKRATAAIA